VKGREVEQNDQVLHEMASESTHCPRQSGRTDLKSGALTDWGVWFDSSGGYAFADTDEVSLNAAILIWMPHIVYDIKPVLSVDQVLANIKKAAAAAKK
jgi:hypothetical protein